MSYDLSLEFEPAIDRRRFLQFFGRRKHYAATDTEILYGNPDTRVGFTFRYHTSRFPLLRKKIHRAEFEINYCRPSFFGLEAEIELTVLVAEFAPKIEDPQIEGMGEGPYLPEGFLRGWNFGNRFSFHCMLSEDPDYKFRTMPQSKVRAAWDWNYRPAEWTEKVHDWPFVPHIGVLEVDGSPRLSAVWPPMGMPILLPKVDYVLVGRRISGEQRFGLATWAEILDVVRLSGMDAGREPLDLRYFRTPDPIMKFFNDIPLIDLDTVPRLPLDEVFDSEILEAASRMRTEEVDLSLIPDEPP
jgi:hypothetical protein